jgi:hypothetical protein
MGNGNSLDKTSVRNPLSNRAGEEGGVGETAAEHQQKGVGEDEALDESLSPGLSLIERSIDVASSNSSTSTGDDDDIEFFDAHSEMVHHQLQDNDVDVETMTCVAFFSLFRKRQKSFLLLNDNDTADTEELEPDGELLSPSSSSSSSSSSLCTPKYKYWTSRSRLFSSSSSFSDFKGDDDDNDNNSGRSEDDQDPPRTPPSPSPSLRPSHKSPRRVNSWISFLSDNKSSSTSLAYYTDEELALSDSQPTAVSDLLSCSSAAAADDDGRSRSHQQRPVWIVTTAALPWMTGTAVNPLLRAAYLSQRYRQQRCQCQCQQEQAEARETENDDDERGEKEEEDTKEESNASTVTTSLVTLVIPWLESADDRIALYGPDWQDATQPEQETYIRKWLAESAGLPLEADPVTGLQIQFYPARYHAGLSSIFAMGDVCERLHVPEYDDSSSSSASHNQHLSAVCILEEPEHLNYYRKSLYCAVLSVLVKSSGWMRCITVRHWLGRFDLFSSCCLYGITK